jgi:hypothetical protein
VNVPKARPASQQWLRRHLVGQCATVRLMSCSRLSLAGAADEGCDLCSGHFRVLVVRRMAGAWVGDQVHRWQLAPR